MKTDFSSDSVSFGKRIDFHTHILPQMDDGSTSIEMSRQMIEVLRNQGVSGIVLSPHFYPFRDNPTHFLNKRKARLEFLRSEIHLNEPLLYEGAEVQYFDGIVSMQELPKMRIGNSLALMIEMPMCTWSNRVIGDISDLNRLKEYRIIIAHMERYLPFGNLPAIRKLAAMGVHMQVNADAFTGVWKSRKALNMLDDGLLHVLGSDCHNITSRSPDLEKAYQLIEKKRGKDMVKKIISNGLNLLSSE